MTAPETGEPPGADIADCICHILLHSGYRKCYICLCLQEKTGAVNDVILNGAC